MDIFVLISGCLQIFLDMGQLEAGKVLVKGLLGGRVGVWEGFVCGENGGIDITVTRCLRFCSRPGLCLSYQDRSNPIPKARTALCLKLYRELCKLCTKLS
jgi:hypothetical protein